MIIWCIEQINYGNLTSHNYFSEWNASLPLEPAWSKVFSITIQKVVLCDVPSVNNIISPPDCVGQCSTSGSKRSCESWDDPSDGALYVMWSNFTVNYNRLFFIWKIILFTIVLTAFHLFSLILLNSGVNVSIQRFLPAN